MLVIALLVEQQLLDHDLELVDSDWAYLRTDEESYDDCLFGGDALGWWGYSTTHACEGYQAP